MERIELTTLLTICCFNFATNLPLNVVNNIELLWIVMCNL